MTKNNMNIENGILKKYSKGFNRGIAQGREQSLLESIRNLMETLHLTAQQAMDVLEVPKEEQSHFASMIDTNN